MKCIGSAVLPQVKEEAGPAALKGNDIHASLEKFIQRGRCESETDSDSERELFRLVGAACPDPGDSGAESAELGVFIDPRNWNAEFVRYEPANSSGSADKRRSGSMGSYDDGAGRKADLLAADGGVDDIGVQRTLSESERAMGFLSVCDLVQRKSASKAEFAIYDWKSGLGYIPNPQYNWQLLCPAVGLWIINGRPDEFYVQGVILYTSITTDDYGNRVFSKPPDRYTYDAKILRNAEWKLRSMYGAMLRASGDRGSASRSVEVDLYEGKHCVFCPARARCPAKVGAVGAALKVALGQEATPEAIVRASMLLVDSTVQIKKAAIEMLELYGGNMDLGDGREAVLEVDKKNKKKVYTKHAKTAPRSDAPEDDQSEAT